MDKAFLIEQVSLKMKLIRVEFDYNQSRMAAVLGLSKKTLVQIEKGRTQAGWTTVVAVCALFRDSDILKSLLGEDPLEVIETVAHDYIDRRKGKTLGGKVWWHTIDQSGSFTLQQNVISQHYRIIDEHHYRWFSSFDQNEAKERYEEMTR
ncbi:helix-turn-helix transcriptional regulator [Thalassobacillus sp. CUG 92003]|uniref:helix-turn-helix transcriptional regulator n=1 Tax=Thalassobacillus sp. CUG 92003 TaxID=2736641 RepID=UPI0015E6D2FC|nr:helix-turn-helix domain-containing protein [Thalassobacillus sp. CUG 92003]